MRCRSGKARWRTKEKIVINADLYGPPAAGGTLANVSPNAVALFRNIARLKLDVRRNRVAAAETAE